MYGRKADGSLVIQGYFPTRGLGSGPAPTSTTLGAPLSVAADGIGSQHSLILNKNHRCLFAVNAGSNTVTAFQVHAGIGLRLINTVNSGGVFPASLAVQNQVLYVLNTGLSGTLMGFTVSSDCGLAPLAGGRQDLAVFTASSPEPKPNDILTTPAQVAFTPKGDKLVISVKGGPAANDDGRVVVFNLTSQGRIAGEGTATHFSAAEKTGGAFGFDFSARGDLIITHVGSFTVSSFTIASNNTLRANGSPLSTGFPFPCWIARSGSYAYLAHFGELPGQGQINGPGTISTVVIAEDGTLSPLKVQGATVTFTSAINANHAIDIAVVAGQDGHSFLYAVQPRLGRVGAWLINADGSLKDLGTFPGLTPGVNPDAPETLQFRERCFLAKKPASACVFGSAQGIAGF
ncbi:lactonase family protein [Candidatus Entotheonella palauensis]|nr:hypothetical protein [Candidatus Entotheonella palauensis]